MVATYHPYGDEPKPKDKNDTLLTHENVCFTIYLPNNNNNNKKAVTVMPFHITGCACCVNWCFKHWLNSHSIQTLGFGISAKWKCQKRMDKHAWFWLLHMRRRRWFEAQQLHFSWFKSVPILGNGFLLNIYLFIKLYTRQRVILHQLYISITLLKISLCKFKACLWVLFY